MCDCPDVLLATARERLAKADTADRDKRTKVHAAVLRRNAMSLAFAAGILRRHHTTTPTGPTP